MSRIILATASPELEERVHYATGGAFLSLPHGPLPDDPDQLFAQLDGAAPPDVVVLDSGPTESAQALVLAARFDQQCPGVSVVLVTDQAADIGLAALRAGVRDILDPGADVADIRLVLDRAGQVARVRSGAQSATAQPPADLQPRVPTGRVVTVVSPKGGVGKTTVASNLAVGLAQEAPHATVVVDLDVQFGDVATALQLQPEYSLSDAVSAPAAHDAMVLKTFLSMHPTGLYAVCGPESPAAADTITGDQISHLLKQLATEFRYVVVDTSPGLSEHTLAALDRTTDLVLLTSMDVPGVRGMRKEIEILEQLELIPESRSVVLNFADTRGGLTVADAAATIGASVHLTLPRSKAAPASMNQGVPLLQSGGRDPMTKGLRQLVSRFTPTPIARPGRRVGRHRAALR